jgi:hypothetical protein
MDQVTMKRTSSRARKAQRDCDGKDCATAARNNYFLGKKLTPDSYRTEQLYSLERRRLLSRAVHGWGVVRGFGLSLEDPDGRKGGLSIGVGLALDSNGRELVQPSPAWFSLENFLVLDKNGALVRQDGDLNERFRDTICSEDDCWLLTAHYAEKKIGPVKISDPCRCDRDEWDRTCETVVYSLKPIPCAECCKQWSCELACHCPPGTDCCAGQWREHDEIERERDRLVQAYNDRVGEFEDENDRGVVALQKEYQPRFDELARKEEGHRHRREPRGGCSCLCEHLTQSAFEAGCAHLTDVDDCTDSDLSSGIDLACLKLAKDECGKWSIQSIEDACGPRRLVKSNDLLFDLINGCDLAYICRTGWAKWHRRSSPPVPFDDFVEALGWKGEIEDEENSTRDFWVEFSRPVRADTLKPDAFVMAVMSDYEDDYWRRYYRVPIRAVETDQVAARQDDPAGHVRSAKLVVWTKWLRNAVLDDDSIFGMGNTRVEIEVRGDLLEDCTGQQIDGNSRGRLAVPTGDGSPGGTYLSTFTVGARVPAPKPQPAPPKEPKQSSTSAPQPRPRSPTRIR